LKKTLTIAMAFVLVAAAAAAIAFRMGRHEERVAHVERAANFDAELDRIRAAEEQPDLYRRCLDYPNPDEFHWSPALIESMCKPLSRRMLTWQEIASALDAHHPEQLDAAFDSYQARGEAGEHGYLTWAFWWMFQTPSKWAAETTKRWIDEDPASAHAHVARGLHRVALAWRARGSDLAANTSEEKFAAAAAYVDQARADFEAALKENPGHIAAYYGLLSTSQIGHEPDEYARRDRWVAAALAIDPADGWIYKEWMDAVQPQWGGSLGLMQDVAAGAAQHADANPSLALFQAEPICNEADALRCDGCDKDGPRSLELYRKAGEIGPAPCFLAGAGAAAVLADDLMAATRYYSQAYRFFGRDEWLAYRAQNLRSLGRGEWALKDLNAANVRDPSNVTVLHALALAYSDAGRTGDVEKAYRRILDAEPDHVAAASDLARLYIQKLNQPENARPLADHLIERDSKSVQGWLLRTMLCDAAGDKACYRDAAAHFLEYANPNDPWQASDIQNVKQKLAEIGS
jgi:tetratricopeptide (TPR) repeat protein